MARFNLFIAFLLASSIPAIARADAIHDAVTSGDLDAVKRLLSSNANLIHVEGNDGLMPIHLAAARDRRAILRFLLANGAGMNDKVVGGYNHVGATPLMIATEDDHTELAIELLQKGADANAGITHGVYAGCAPIHNALSFGDRVLIEKLIEAGADVNAGGAAGETPLFYALEARSRMSETQRLILMRLLLTKGADVNAKFRNETLLHIATEQDWLNIASLLLDKGIDVNATNRAGLTAFGIASKAGHTKMMDLLKSRGGTE
jgi:ankyrin repeat protein